MCLHRQFWKSTCRSVCTHYLIVNLQPLIEINFKHVHGNVLRKGCYPDLKKEIVGMKVISKLQKGKRIAKNP